MIRYYRHPLSTYFYFDPFKLLYVCYDIRLELANKFPVFNWFPFNIHTAIWKDRNKNMETKDVHNI